MANKILENVRACNIPHQKNDAAEHVASAENRNHRLLVGGYIMNFLQADLVILVRKKEDIYKYGANVKKINNTASYNNLDIYQ